MQDRVANRMAPAVRCATYFYMWMRDRRPRQFAVIENCRADAGHSCGGQDR